MNKIIFKYYKIGFAVYYTRVQFVYYHSELIIGN